MRWAVSVGKDSWVGCDPSWGDPAVSHRWLLMVLRVPAISLQVAALLRTFLVGVSLILGSGGSEVGTLMM